MLDWLFPPACPCDPAAKAWVEERLAWLDDQFADSAFTGRRVVLPTAACFPDYYPPNLVGVRRLVEQVCDYMDVEPYLVDIEIVERSRRLGYETDDADEATQEEAGHVLLRLDRTEIDPPMGLVGLVAYELAQVRLIDEGRVDPDEYDVGLLTDLTTVHFGLGVFLANARRDWDSPHAHWPGTKIYKPEFMTPAMFGYALAHLAWFRDEAEPAWADQLRWDARGDFRQGLRFLQKTARSAYRPERLG